MKEPLAKAKYHNSSNDQLLFRSLRSMWAFIRVMENEVHNIIKIYTVIQSGILLEDIIIIGYMQAN